MNARRQDQAATCNYIRSNHSDVIIQGCNNHEIYRNYCCSKSCKIKVGDNVKAPNSVIRNKIQHKNT